MSTPQLPADFQWLIYAREHNAWWKPNELGYTTDVRRAGRYGFEHAQRIVHLANEHHADDAAAEFMYPELPRLDSDLIAIGRVLGPFISIGGVLGPFISMPTQDNVEIEQMVRVLCAKEHHFPTLREALLAAVEKVKVKAREVKR